MDLEVTSLDIYYISKILEKEFLLGYINNIQNVSDNIIKLKIHKTQTKQLFITDNLMFLSNYNIDVTESKGLLKYIKKRIYNQRIHEISQHKNNRVIYFKLDSHYLIFEMFSGFNIILTDMDFNIVTLKKTEYWKDRTLKAKEVYKFPENKDIKEIDLEKIITEIKTELKKEIKDLDKKEIIRFFIKKYNIAPNDMNDIKYKTNLEFIKKIKELYNKENIEFYIKDLENKKILKIKELQKDKDNFEKFKDIENLFLKNLKQNKTIKKDSKKNEFEKIKKKQENTKIKYQKEINKLEKQAEKIYLNFNIIDVINKQIKIAIDKGYDNKIIIQKINKIIEKEKIKIKNINRKNRSYNLECLDK